MYFKRPHANSLEEQIYDVQYYQDGVLIYWRSSQNAVAWRVYLYGGVFRYA